MICFRALGVVSMFWIALFSMILPAHVRAESCHELSGEKELARKDGSASIWSNARNAEGSLRYESGELLKLGEKAMKASAGWRTMAASARQCHWG